MRRRRGTLYTNLCLCLYVNKRRRVDKRIHASTRWHMIRTASVLLLSIVLVSASIIHDSSLSARHAIKVHVRAVAVKRFAHNSTTRPPPRHQPHDITSGQRRRDPTGRRASVTLTYIGGDDEGVQGAATPCFILYTFSSALPLTSHNVIEVLRKTNWRPITPEEVGSSLSARNP